MKRAALAIPTSIALALCAASWSHAATLEVPGDFGSIQDAINAAAAGDTILVSGGTYAELLTLTGKTDLTIKARGSDKVFVDGGGGGSTLLKITSSTNILIKKLRFQNTTGNGIDIALSLSITIEKCRVKDVGGDGINLALNFPCTIKGCKIKDVGDDGIEMLSAAAIIQDNQITRPADSGIVVHGDTSSIEGNTIDSAKSGITLGEDNVPTVQCLVADNTILNSSADAIRLADDARACLILDNIIKDTSLGDCIDVQQASNDHVVMGNRCIGTTNTGIEVDGDGLILEGNKVKKCFLGINVQPNADNALVLRNKVKKSITDGLVVETGNNGFIQNTVKGSGGFDLVDTAGAGANGYSDNSFGTISP